MLAAHRQLDVAAGLGVLRGVVQEIGHDLRQPHGVAAQAHRAAGQRHGQVMAERIDQRHGGVHRPGDHAGQVHGLELQPDLPQGDARDVEEVVHQTRQWWSCRPIASRAQMALLP